jgi:hypothetical protein
MRKRWAESLLCKAYFVLCNAGVIMSVRINSVMGMLPLAAILLWIA